MIGFKEILIVLVVVLLVFGTKKLRSLGSDLGTSLKDFKKAMRDEEPESAKHVEQNAEPPFVAEKTVGQADEQRKG